MNKLSYLLLLLGVPLMLAGVLASGSYAWNTFTVDPRPVHAEGAGVDTKDGYTVTTIHDGDQEYLAVSTYAPYAGDRDEDKGKKRQFLSLYEVVHKSGDQAGLVLICSRCIEWDRGFELLNLKADDNRPSKLKAALEK